MATTADNVRYAVDVCLYSFPATPKSRSSPCDIDFACAPLKKALISGGLEPSNDTAYGYCSADGGNFLGSNLAPCIQCLQSTTDQVYTSNCESDGPGVCCNTTDVCMRL